ncbi:MAG: D-mannonate epimerase, partial [Terracidiphilus sp.]
IHGSSEGRFTITWCPGHLGKDEVESVGFDYGDLGKMLKMYDPAMLGHGYNKVGGDEIFYVANPALGLWAHSSRLQSSVPVAV